MSTHTPVLKCGSCEHLNEPERVYCHNCGEKLDRSLLPKPAAENQTESLEMERKRVKKMMSAGRKSWVSFAMKNLFFVLLFAALLAGGFLFWQAPEGIPPEKSEELPERDAGEIWDRMMATQRPVTEVFTELEINTYLRRAIKSSGSTIPGMEFKRAFVRIEQDVFTIFIQRELWGIKLYSSLSYRTSKDGKFDPEVVNVRFGRLNLHPSLKVLGEFSLKGVFNVFEKEKSHLTRIADLRSTSKGILLITKPAQ